ncbi:MAG: hypoxanthine phosphoribosyltransferase [Bacteroidales bacterium]|nr:hypoxanthine phosphoribosyltransferase [Bacteroidales bacterium]
MEKRIRLHDKTFRMFIPNADIEKAIDAVAARLNKDYADSTDEDPVVLLCTLNGAIIYAAELLKRIQFPLVLKACKLSSYDGVSSTGVVKTEVPLPEHLEGKRVLIVEDIVDTGNTIVALMDQLKAHNVRDARVCTLLLKKEVYKKDVKLDYVAMEIPNRFIVGFGLDYDELGRNIKDIFVLDE